MTSQAKTTTSIRDKLLSAADALESIEFPEARTIGTDLSINAFGVKTREQLAEWAKLLTHPKKGRSGDTCWLKGELAGAIELCVFYEVGLLGEVVETPSEASVESLLAEFAEAEAVA